VFGLFDWSPIPNHLDWSPILNHHTRPSAKEYPPDGPFRRELCKSLGITIRNEFTPAFTGLHVCDDGKQRLYLHIKHRGRCPPNIQETTATQNIENSTLITAKP